MNKEEILLKTGWEKYTKSTYMKTIWRTEQSGGANWYRHESLDDAWKIYQSDVRKYCMLVEKPLQLGAFEPWHTITIGYMTTEEYHDCDYNEISPYNPDYPPARYVELIICDGDGGKHIVRANSSDGLVMDIRYHNCNECEHDPVYFMKAMNAFVTALDVVNFEP